jgi:subtilisin family serine protease
MNRRRFLTIAGLLIAAIWIGCSGDESLLSPAGSPASKLLGAEGRVLIGFNGQPDSALVAAVGGTIRYVYQLVPAIAATVPEAAVDLLRANPAVAYVEEDAQVVAVDAELDNTWGVKRIGGGVVHDAGNRGAGVKVAILDTGMDYTHPDLDGNYAGGFDFVNNDPNPMDDHGHGTHVAGTVGAEDNGVGVVGVAPQVRLYALKVLNGAGNGFSSDVIAALQWCVNNGIRVTNNSYGSLIVAEVITLQAAFDNSAAAGVLHVAAAGNSGNALGTGDNVVFPARYASVIAVAATDWNNARASFSSTGPDVELAAPGVAVTSTLRNGGYNAQSGTSMASPHVAGTAALIIASGVSGPNAVRQRLQQTADDLSLPGRDPQYGFGLVDADGAVLGEGGGGGGTPSGDAFLLWNGETGEEQNGPFYYGSANLTQTFKGTWCFEGTPDPWHAPGIGLNGQQSWRTDLSQHSEIRFYAKADAEGKTFDFSVYAWPEHSRAVNIDPFIEGGRLTTSYRLVRIPIIALQTPTYRLDKVEILYFGTAKPTAGHRIYIDEVWAE